jgi:hypothetical protein
MTASNKEELLSLIDNQIAYWNKVKINTIGQEAQKPNINYFNECLHESDGKRHLFNDDGGNFFMNKCIKCARFYK